MLESAMQPIAQPDVEERSRESTEFSRDWLCLVVIHNDEVPKHKR